MPAQPKSKIKNEKSKIPPPSPQPNPNNPTPQSPDDPIPLPLETRNPKLEAPNDSTPQSPDASIPTSSFILQTSDFPPPFPLFPPAHLTLLLGLPGTGKSLLALHLAARLSHYSLLPLSPFLSTPLPEDFDSAYLHEEQLPSTSYICSREDHQSTIDRRLSVAAASVNPRQPAADTRVIHFIQGSLVLPPGYRNRIQAIEKRRSTLVHALANTLDSNTRLIVLDPLPAFLDHTDASNNPALIRAALDPLLELAASFNISLLGISHLTKDRHKNPPLEHAARSHAYTSLARSVLLLSHDPVNPNRRILSPIKNNLAHIQGNYAFTIHQHPDPANPNLHPIPYIEWENEILPFANSFNAPAVPPENTDPFSQSQLDFAIHFLQTLLHNGPIPSAQLLRQARALGISNRTLARARFHLNVQCTIDHTCRWQSHLPGPPPDYII